MKITFSPTRMDDALELEKQGDVLIVNGDDFDFGDLDDDSVLPSDAIDSPWFIGDVRREAGQLSVELLLPHGPDAGRARLFPAPLEVTRDGPISLADYDGETR